MKLHFKSANYHIPELLLFHSIRLYVIFAIIITLVHLALEYGEAEKHLFERVEYTHKSFMGTLEQSTWTLDITQIKEIAGGIMLSPDLLQVEVKDTLGDSLVTERASNRVCSQSEAKSRTLYEPNSSTEVGEVVYTVNKCQVMQTVEKTLVFIILISIIKSFILWAIVLFVSRRYVQKPLHLFSKLLNSIELTPHKAQVIDENMFHTSDMRQMVHNLNYVLESLYKNYHARTLYEDELKAANTNLKKQVIEEQARSLEAARLAALGEMASGVAHEINNPLAVIKLKLNQLRALLGQEQPMMDKVQLNINNVESFVNRISSIISSMRELSGSSSQESFEKISSAKLIQTATNLCTARALNHGTQILVDDTAKQSLYIQPHIVEQALLNIINNAIDACEYKDNTHISIRSYDRNNMVVIEVEDNGNGISTELKEKVFEPFFTTKAPGKGQGLGLSLAKNLLERNGGSLDIDLQREQTVFMLVLPTTV